MFIREGRKKQCICHYEQLIQFQYQLPSTSSSSSESSSLSKVLSGISYSRNTGLLGSFTMRYWKLNVRYFYIESNLEIMLLAFLFLIWGFDLFKNTFPSFCCITRSIIQRTMPHALSIDRLIWLANSSGLNCCEPRMT